MHKVRVIRCRHSSELIHLSLYFSSHLCCGYAGQSKLEYWLRHNQKLASNFLLSETGGWGGGKGGKGGGHRPYFLTAYFLVN